MLLQPDGDRELSVYTPHVVRVAVAGLSWHENGEWGASDDEPVSAALGIQSVPVGLLGASQVDLRR